MQPSPSRRQEKEEPNFEMRDERNATSTEAAGGIRSLTPILLLLLCLPQAACAFFESIKEGEESQTMSPLARGGCLQTMIPDVKGETEVPKPQAENQNRLDIVNSVG